MAKAYDRMNWSFINNVLVEVGFSGHLIKVIMDLISMVKMVVLWKGQNEGYFSTGKSLRQGDLIPLPLCPMYGEVISPYNYVVDNGHWDCLRTGRYGPKIPHLMFDDDVLLFGKASEQQIVRIKDVLDTFCESYGQKVTYEKSSILFSKKILTL